MCALPIPRFPTGVMRGRFYPTDGQLYCCGMFAWAGDQTQPGGFYRVRYTGKPVYLPIGLSAKKTGMTIKFSAALDPNTAGEPQNYAVKTWSLKRSEQYGSKHYDEKPAKVTAAKLSDDGKTLTLEIADIKPTWSMEIRYNMKASDGSTVQGLLHKWEELTRSAEHEDTPWCKIGDASRTAAASAASSMCRILPPVSSHRPAPVDYDGLPGDVAGFMAGEELYRRGHFFERDEPFLRHRLQHDAVDHLLHTNAMRPRLRLDLGIDQRRSDVGGADGVDRYVGVGGLERNDFAQAQ
jgi:hypothetical protein